MTLPEWRRIQLDEGFFYGYEENGQNPGYVVGSHVLLHNHQTCGCILSRSAVRVKWFLPHSCELHGRYPIDYSRHVELLGQLIHEKPWMELGFCLRLIPSISYGNLVRLEPSTISALSALHLMGSTAQLHEDNTICIWLEDARS